MAEKRVSVRLAAVGGRQVQAEIAGIGETGAQSFRKIRREVDVTNAALARIAGVLGGALSIRQIAAYADSWSELRSRVVLATGAQETGAAVMQRLAEMARRTYSNLEQTAESWLANATALRELGLTTRESLDFTEALNNAMVVSGARAERAASVQNALSKAMALGTLSGDNLNTVIQSGGRLAELLAAELGTTVSGLRTLGQQGAITGDVIRTALIGNLERLREEADSMPATIGDAFTLIGNAALQLVGTWDQMAGASSMVAEGLILVADNLERLAAIGIAFAGFMAGRWVAAFVAARVATFSLSGALTLLRGALIRTGIGALIVAAGELIYQFGRLVQATGGFGAALGLLGGVATEVWDRIGLLAGVLKARIDAAWSGIQASIADALQASLEAVVTFANRIIGAFQGAFDAMVVIWSNLPRVIGDLTIQAANLAVAGLESMLNGAVNGINALLKGVNAGLAAIGIERTIELVPDVDLGRIENEFVGAASRAGNAARDAFAAAFETDTFATPDFGLTAFAENARAAADRARATATALGELAGAPLASIAALREAMAGANTEIDDAAEATERLDEAFAAIGGAGGDAAGDGEGSAGSAARAAEASHAAGEAAASAATQAATGWAAVREELSRYASEAMDWGKGLGSALTSAFRSAEDAIANFVTGGKIDFKALADSILADITRIAVRSAILGPLANALGGGSGGLLGGLFGGGGGLFAGIFHQGGVAGGPAQQRLVPAFAFAGAPRFHDGGLAGLRADEVPAILQRGEMVLSRAQLAAIGAARETRPPVNVVMNISTPDAGSFRYAQGQIAADAARAMERARRNL
ncbi:tape measure domain [Chelatococcus sambhunathii]|uniref:Tape measure domain n=2 Tax=Chelatococcus sambhunathii TaxID=363953 RepID=A0ABP2AAC7_9HYPH|nr:tape measure domain [Chelatococcus sambhunathii]